MGCGSSSPAAVAAPGGAHADIEKKLTAGTDAMNSSDRNKKDASAGGVSAGKDTNAAVKIFGDFKPSTSSISVKVGNLSIRYAAKSRRGRDPDNPNKAK